MCIEAETLCAMMGSKAKQIVLIGDHKQLQPVVQCKNAKRLGLGISMFERFSDQAQMLKIQYRMVSIDPAGDTRLCTKQFRNINNLQRTNRRPGKVFNVSRILNLHFLNISQKCAKTMKNLTKISAATKHCFYVVVKNCVFNSTKNYVNFHPSSFTMAYSRPREKF
jgi:superfamily I DNA and/or RNA helicase